jgi:hypothetical protein
MAPVAGGRKVFQKLGPLPGRQQFGRGKTGNFFKQRPANL